MELLAPAGGWEQLECAVAFGADAVYLATPRYGMRHRADNFAEADIPRAVAFAHARGAAVHVTANTIMSDADTDDLPRYFAMLADAGVDAFIVADAGAIAIAREAAPRVAIHLSTQASVMNAAAARLYASLGVTRIVVAREMGLSAIAEMRRRLPQGMQIEAFAHGSMCMAYSGRCLISDYLVGDGRGANKGNCAQPCRWGYTLVERTRPGQSFDIEEELPAAGGAGASAPAESFIMSSNDMCMLEHLDDLAAAGVDSIKIEGRAKGAYYVAAVVNAYRHVLDGEPASMWASELETVSHRPYSTGFYYGDPGQNAVSDQYVRAYRMVARVAGIDAAASGTGRIPPADVSDGPGAGDVGSECAAAAARGDTRASGTRALLVCRNRFAEGDVVEALRPTAPIESFEVKDLVWHAPPDFDLTDVRRDAPDSILGPDPARPGGHLVKVDVANRTIERYSCAASVRLSPSDILRTKA